MNLKNFNKINKLIIFCFLFLIITSCSKLGDWELIEYDGSINWEQVIKSAEWKERQDHEIAILNDELYLVGGYNPGNFSDDPYFEDVWKSSDGKSWVNLVEDAPWYGRKGHSLVTFNDGTGDALFLIGGFSVNESTGERAYNNDVWKSNDGANWTEIKDSTEWTARMHHKCVLTNHDGIDYIYLVGGYTMSEDVEARYGIKYFDDTWRTSDGVNWTSVGITDIGIRAEHAMAVDENGIIYMQGGQHGVIFEAADSSDGNPIRGYSDVWMSTDGQNWTNTTDSLIIEADFFSRTSHEMVYYRDKIWGLPGKTNSLNHYAFTNPNHYGTWTIDANGYLDIDTHGVAIDARHNYSSIVWRDKIWIFGGNTNSFGPDNDIWVGNL